MKTPQEIKETPHQELTRARLTMSRIQRLRENQDFLWLNGQQQLKLDSEVIPIFSEPVGVDSELKNLYRRGKVAGMEELLNYILILETEAKAAVDQLKHLDSENEQIGEED